MHSDTDGEQYVIPTPLYMYQTHIDIEVIDWDSSHQPIETEVEQFVSTEHKQKANTCLLLG